MDLLNDHESVENHVKEFISHYFKRETEVFTLFVIFGSLIRSVIRNKIVFLKGKYDGELN